MKRLLFFIFFSCTFFANAQLLEVDYSIAPREENSVRLHLIRQGIIGLNTLQHLNSTLEVAKVRVQTKNKVELDFALFGTRTFWSGNKNDQLNSLSYVTNHIGGDINASLFLALLLHRQPDRLSKIGLHLAKKWIQAQALTFKDRPWFQDNFGRLGWVYQKRIAEDPLANTSLYWIAYPYALAHYTVAEKQQQFFGTALEPFSYGYGFETGINYNNKIKLLLLGHQLLNAHPEGALGKFVVSLSIGYQF